MVNRHAVSGRGVLVGGGVPMYTMGMACFFCEARAQTMIGMCMSSREVHLGELKRGDCLPTVDRQCKRDCEGIMGLARASVTGETHAFRFEEC